MSIGLIALLDDIASVLDDVAVLTKLATKKTAGVLGDDLAVNAEQVNGVRASRELPVVWAVAKGSALNKAILVPAALVLSVVAPWAIVPVLMVGGGFLCYEGFEKLAHRFAHGSDAEAARRAALAQAVADPAIDVVALEKSKIRGAIRTDFVLSAEIVVIALGTVATAAFGIKVAVLVGIAILMTIGVYGAVAGIVKLDDAGLYLGKRKHRAARALGAFILAAAPWFMKGLSVAGTTAMFLVGGGILAHGIAPLGHAIEGAGAHVGGGWGTLVELAGNAIVGIAAGALILFVAHAARRVWSLRAAAQ